MTILQLVHKRLKMFGENPVTSLLVEQLKTKHEKREAISEIVGRLKVFITPPHDHSGIKNSIAGLHRLRIISQDDKTFFNETFRKIAEFEFDANDQESIAALWKMYGAVIQLCVILAQAEKVSKKASSTLSNCCSWHQYVGDCIVHQEDTEGGFLALHEQVYFLFNRLQDEMKS